MNVDHHSHNHNHSTSTSFTKQNQLAKKSIRKNHHKSAFYVGKGCGTDSKGRRVLLPCRPTGSTGQAPTHALATVVSADLTTREDHEACECEICMSTIDARMPHLTHVLLRVCLFTSQAGARANGWGQTQLTNPLTVCPPSSPWFLSMGARGVRNRVQSMNHIRMHD